MNRTILTIGIAFLICSDGRAIEIEFAGQKPENAKSILERLKSENNPSFALLDSLNRSLSNNAYLDASIIIMNGKLMVSSGQKYILSSITINGDSARKVEVNRPFDSAHVALAVEEQLQIYRDSGYHFVSGQTENVILNDTLVTLEFSLNKGPLVKAGETLFTGLTRTDRGLIKRFLQGNDTAALTSGYIIEAERAAEQIPFVKFQPPIMLQPRPGYTVSDIVFNFLEKTPVRIDGAAGLGGKNESGAVWSLALSLNNLFGQGKQVSVVSQRRDSKRKTLDVHYAQPFFLLGLGELNFNLHTRDYRENFYEFGLDAGIGSRINRSFTTGVKFGWKSVKPEIGNTGYNRYTGQFSLMSRSFSDAFNPSQGLEVKWGIDFSFRQYTVENTPGSFKSRTFNETRSRLAAELYQPVAGAILGHLTVNYDGLETVELLPPLSELVLLGGPGSLRGYRNEQFAAIRAAYGTVEPRIRFSQGFITVFCDVAYLNNRLPDSSGQIFTVEMFRWSYGLGFGLGNELRSLEISLGINPDFGLNDPRLSIELSSDI